MKVIEYIAPIKAAKQIGIAPATLRKYVNLIENLASNKDYFMRDENNRRLYSKEDVTLIKRIIQLKKADGETLESSIIKALGDNSKIDVSSSETTDNSAITNETEALYDVINKQQAQLDKYSSFVDQLTKNNIELSNDLKNATTAFKQANASMIEHKENTAATPKKTGLFARLFSK